MPKVGDVSILGWGGYIPRYRIKLEDIEKVWGDKDYSARVRVYEKAVAGPDEDATTIAVEAAKNAIARAGIDPKEIDAVFFGSESKPYAVKPTITVVIDALGLKYRVFGADVEFACKGGTDAMVICIGLVRSGIARYGLAIGADTAQGVPGDHLDYTTASGGAAFVLGPKTSDAAAYIEGVASYISDTPDFWRRDAVHYPLHTEAFTGEPAYFRHIVEACKALMEDLGLKPSDFDYAVFHQPNGTFPLRVAKMLGIPKEKVLPGLLSPYIGNTYSGASMLGLAAVLDIAKPGERILVASFGSGAGSDAFSIVVQDGVEERRGRAPTVKYYLDNKVYIDYALYAKFRRKYIMV